MRRTGFFLIGLGVGLFIILILQQFGWAQGGKVDLNAPAATVNGEVIKLADVDEALRQRPVPLTPPTAAQVRQVRMEALTAIIDETLLRQFLRDNGPKIDPADVDKQVSALTASLKAKDRTLADYLRDLRLTEAQFRANLAMLMQLDRYVREHATEADLRKYFEANRDYFNKTTVRTSHIVLRLPPDASAAEKERATQKLRTLRHDIATGALDFAKAARENSHCPSAPKGGDIGVIERKFQNLDETYAKAAFALKIGEVSDVVETEFGLHLIKVTARNEGKPVEFEKAADDVRDCYADDLRVALLGRLRDKAKVEITLP